MAYSFTAAVASRGYHVYKNTSWTNAKVREKVTVEMETKNPHWKSIRMLRVPLKLKIVSSTVS